MKSIVTLLLCLVVSQVSTAFQTVVRPGASYLGATAPPQGAFSLSSSSSSSTALHVFGNKRSGGRAEAAADALAERARKAGVAAGFWEGEWVCKDCGYIYNRVRPEVSVS